MEYVRKMDAVSSFPDENPGPALVLKNFWVKVSYQETPVKTFARNAEQALNQMSVIEVLGEVDD